jgi:hypothetical protein
MVVVVVVVVVIISNVSGELLEMFCTTAQCVECHSRPH